MKKRLTFSEFKAAMPGILDAFKDAMELDNSSDQIITDYPDDWMWDLSVWAQNRDADEWEQEIN